VDCGAQLRAFQMLKCLCGFPCFLQRHLGGVPGLRGSGMRRMLGDVCSLRHLQLQVVVSLGSWVLSPVDVA